jgi:hypothetical protein
LLSEASEPSAADPNIATPLNEEEELEKPDPNDATLATPPNEPWNRE